MRMTQAVQVLAGFLAALVTAGLVLWLVFGLLFFLDDPEAPFEGLWGLTLKLAYLGVMSALPVVLVGAPVLYMAFRRMGWFSPARSVAGGAVLGALVLPVRLILLGKWQGLLSLEVLGYGLFGAVAGAVGGLVFWWIAARPLDPTGQTKEVPEAALPGSEG